ncbi:MAG: hypothetical protein AB4372_22005 [Xenococcus sp. (in: cyanobacteria)]
MKLSLAPRYRLDDDSSWLLAIDPVRRYWIATNGDENISTEISGLLTSDKQEFREVIIKFRGLTPGETLNLPTYGELTQIYCVATNCYAIVGEVSGAEVWHLFDREKLESLLMTAHPDWLPNPKDIERSRRLLSKSWEKSLVS